MAFLFKQNLGTSATAATLAVIWNVATVPGDMFIVLATAAHAIAALTISDTAKHTWTRATVLVDTVNSVELAVFYAFSQNIYSAGTTTTITINAHDGAIFHGMSIATFSSTSKKMILGGACNGLVAQSSVTPTGGAVTPPYNNVLIYGAAVDTITAAGAGYTLIGTGDGATDIPEYKIAVGEGGVTQQPTWTGSGVSNTTTVWFCEPQFIWYTVSAGNGRTMRSLRTIS